MNKQVCCSFARWRVSLAGGLRLLFAGVLAMAGLAQAQSAQPGAPQRIEPGSMAARTAACTQCHGPQGGVGADGYYPRLAGKPAAYLYQQLQHFRDGARFYTPMAHLLRGLPDAYLREMAEYFSQQHVPYPPPARPAAGAAVLSRGRQLAETGDAALGLPACAACHGATLSGMAPGIPGLLGLPLDYIGAQIGSWRSGLRRARQPDCMGDIAKRMAPADIAAVSAWLAALPVTEPYVPERMVGELPMACGAQAAGERP